MPASLHTPLSVSVRGGLQFTLNFQAGSLPNFRVIHHLDTEILILQI